MTTNLTIPNTFVAGTTEVAADVNANFTAIQTMINTTGVPLVQAGTITSTSIDATVAKAPNIQEFTSSGTWTKPSGAVRVDYLVVGGGGGGAGGLGSGSTTYVSGSAGTASSVGSVLGAFQGAGAIASVNSQWQNNSTVNVPVPGCGGAGGGFPGSPSAMGGRPGSLYATNLPASGGSGGGGYGSGGDAGQGGNTAGGSAAANSGGGGGGFTNLGSVAGGAGGQGGQVCRGVRLATDFGATETVTIGAGGAGGVSTVSGGAGGSGRVVMITYFS